MMTRHLGKRQASDSDRGVSLIETMIAVVVALVGVFGLGSLIFQATVTNKNQGTEVTRATIYAQDKMEKLLSFNSAGVITTTGSNYYTCTQSITSQPIYCNSSGISATGWNTGLVAGGAASPMQGVCPSSGTSVGYIDFLDSTGNQYTGASCASVPSASIAYVRMWSISDMATTGGPSVKKVTVAVYSKAAIATVGGTSAKPVVLLVSYISNPNSCGTTEKTNGCPL